MCNSRFIPLPGRGSALQTLSEESLGHTVFSSSPSTQTAGASPAEPKISHRSLLCCRPSYKTSKYSVFCGPDTTSSPISRGEEENSKEIYIITDWPACWLWKWAGCACQQKHRKNSITRSEISLQASTFDYYNSLEHSNQKDISENILYVLLLKLRWEDSTRRLHTNIKLQSWNSCHCCAK